MDSEDKLKKYGFSEEWSFVLGIMLGQMLKKMPADEVLSIIKTVISTAGFQTYETDVS